MAPFGIIYIMNWIIFVIIMASLLRKKRNMGKTDDKTMMTKLKQQFIIALTLSLLFGLGWGVGFTATTSIPSSGVSFTLQAIFIFLTGFQGLLIFIMYCLRSEEARTEWKVWVTIVTCHRINLVSRKKTSTKFTSQSGENKRSTLSTAAFNSDTLKKAVQRDMEGSTVYSNKSSTFSNSTLETIEEAEKKDLSLKPEEKDKYKLYPHHEDEEEEGHSANGGESESSTSSKPALSPATDRKKLLVSVPRDTDDGEPLAETLEVVSPKEAPKEEKVQDKFNIFWVGEEDDVIANTELVELPSSPPFNVQYFNGDVDGFGADRDTAL